MAPLRPKLRDIGPGILTNHNKTICVINHISSHHVPISVMVRREVLISVRVIIIRSGFGLGCIKVFIAATSLTSS